MSYQSQLKIANARGWNWPRRKRDFDGKLVRTLREYRNNAGDVIPEGATCDATSSGSTINLHYGKVFIRFGHRTPDMEVIGETNAGTNKTDTELDPE